MQELKQSSTKTHVKDIIEQQKYARSDSEMKLIAFEKVSSNSVPTNLPALQNDKGLIFWLHSLCKSK